MARNNKYNKLKPQINVPTLIVVGIVMITLILTIILSVDTPKQKFTKTFNLDKSNNYEVINLKKLEKLVKGDEDILVVITNIAEQNDSALLIPELQKAYSKTDEYAKYDYKSIKEDFKKIYYINTAAISDFNDFFKEHKIKNRTQLPIVLAFKDGKVIEYVKGHADVLAENDIERVKVRLSLKDFFDNINK